MDFDFFFGLFVNSSSYFFYFFLLSFFGYSYSFVSFLVVKFGLNFYEKKNNLNKIFLYKFFIDFNFFYCLFLKNKKLKLMKIDFLKKIKVYKGFRFLNKLPVRGQNTRSNAKTSKKGIF
jgi:hypothetical protein